MKLTPADKQKLLQKEPEDLIDEVVQELIQECTDYQNALKEANENTALWRQRYIHCSALIGANHFKVIQDLHESLTLIVSQIKPKFQNQKDAFNKAQLALEVSKKYLNKETQ
jgi:hypothetical protein